MRRQVEAWQPSELIDVTAKVVIYEAFVEGKLEAPKHLARTVHELYFLCGAEIYVALALESIERRAVCAENDHISNAAALVKSQLGRKLFLLDRFSPHQSLPGRLGGWEDWRNGRNVGEHPCELALS
jgi:hypothetical protein